MKANRYVVVESYAGHMCKGILIGFTFTTLEGAIETAKSCHKNNNGLWFVCEIKEVVGDKQNPE